MYDEADGVEEGDVLPAKWEGVAGEVRAIAADRALIFAIASSCALSSAGVLTETEAGGL